MKSPQSEQTICITCGFCCDGTLFYNATLQPGEKGTLPSKMEEAYLKIGEEEFFRLPCQYFDGKCTIYDQKKAHICSAFRCELLKDFSGEKISQQSAIRLIENAERQRAEIRELANKIIGTPPEISFRHLLLELRKVIHAKENNGEPKNRELEILLAKCTIFEALLIRHFKPAKDFDSMKMPVSENLKGSNAKPALSKNSES